MNVYTPSPGWNYYNDNDGTYDPRDSWADARTSIKGMSHDHQVVFKDQHGKKHYVEDGLNSVESITINNKTLVFATNGTTTKEQITKQLSKKLFNIATTAGANMREAKPKTYNVDINIVRGTHTGRIGAGKYTGVISGTKDQVEVWCEALKRDYHPAGYGTTTEIRKGLKTNTWYAQYSRQGSCD